MAEPARVFPTIDQEVEQALALCGGDPIKALQVTLIANAFLEARLDQLTAEVSAGFSRGRVRNPAQRRKPEGGAP
jgi:hypothetical protein